MNEDWMTELEIRAGDELERKMARYARVRLDPSQSQVRRARDSVMEAAWRQRISGAPGVSAAEGQLATSVGARAITQIARRHGPFAGWGARRLGGSLAAAVLAGLLVGSTAFATSRAGGPLYEGRLALEELTLPADGPSRLEAELALAQGRLAEIVDGASRDDAGAVAAAVHAYLAVIDELGVSTGGPADRALVVVQQHAAVLEAVLGRVPEQARNGIEQAITHSETIADTLSAAGTHPNANGGSGGMPTDNGTGTGGNGNGNGGTGGAGNGGGTGGTGGAGNGGQPAKSQPPIGPDRTPRPAKTPKPADTATAKPERPTPAPDITREPNGQGDHP